MPSHVAHRTSSVLAALLCVATTSCKDRGPRPEDAPDASAVPSTSASGAAQTSDVDPEIARALEGVASCDAQERKPVAKGPDGEVDLAKTLESLLCPAEEALSELLGKTTSNDDYLQTRRTKVTRTCARALEHASRSVRRAAHDCVADHPEGLGDERAALERLLAGLEKETDSGVRRARWKAIGALDPSARGLAARATAVARAGAGDDFVLARALEALVPRSDYVTTAPEVLDYAKELAKAGRVGDEVVELVQHSAATPAEACAIYVDLLESKGARWHDGLDGVLATLGRCRAVKGRIVDAIVQRTVQAKSAPAAWGLFASYAVRGVGDLGLDANEKAKLRGALRSLTAAHRGGRSGDAAIDQALETLR